MGPHPPGGSLPSCGVRACGGGRTEAAERSKRLDEALLGRVFGVGGRARDDVGGAKRDLLVALHDLLIGGRIAALRACDEHRIVRWPALHRNESSTPGAASWFPCNRWAGTCVDLSRWRARSASSSDWSATTRTASMP